jgi:hypothetical protein
MTRLTVDAATRARLHNLQDLSEVSDESGPVLGYFHPILPPRSLAACPAPLPFYGRRNSKTPPAA